MPKKRKRFKKASKLLVVVGSLSLLMLSPIHHNDTLGKYMDSLTGRTWAQAAEADPFSPRWEIDGSGTWHYRLDNGGLATNCWVQDEVNGDWYLLDASGNMLSGVFESYGKYYLLDTVRGTGHYGRLLKNGQEFNGVIIQADTSADYEGALSDATISALQNAGVSFTGVPGISGTQHVSNGVVTSAGGGAGTTVASAGASGASSAGSGGGSVTNNNGNASNDTTSNASDSGNSGGSYGQYGQWSSWEDMMAAFIEEGERDGTNARIREANAGIDFSKDAHAFD